MRVNMLCMNEMTDFNSYYYFIDIYTNYVPILHSDLCNYVYRYVMLKSSNGKYRVNEDSRFKTAYSVYMYTYMCYVL